MSKYIKRISPALGLPPGTLVHIGDKKLEKAIITLFDFDQNNVVERKLDNIEECFPFKEKTSVTWINIDGLQQVEIIEKIDTHFDIHSLVLEDILNTVQRPKMEDYGEYIFIVAKMLYVESKHKDMISEQISIILGSNYVISFQETDGDIFNEIRDRIRNYKGRVRKMGADYLAYCLIDAIVDNYFIVLEYLGDEIEKMDDRLISNGSQSVSMDIHLLKRDLIFLRKQTWPLREVISALQRIESKLIKKTTGIFLSDVYDHTIQVIDTIESYRDELSGMQDVYISNINNRLNEIMKVLTVFTSIFIPLNLIAGIYGMNFRHMPELEWKGGYFWALSLMVVTGLCLLFFFKKKKWF